MSLNYMPLDISHDITQNKTPREAGRGDHIWIGGSNFCLNAR